MKNKIMPTVVLTAICLSVALLLTVINMITYPAIQANLLEKENEAKREILPMADSFSDIDLTSIDGEPKGVTAAFKADNGSGFVFKVETKGYDEGLVLMIGIDKDGKIAGTSVISSNETFGAENLLGGEYVGKDEWGASTVIKKNSATLTSNAFNQAIKDSYATMHLITAGGGN